MHQDEPDAVRDWAEQEFGSSALGDARLNARLTGLARQLAQHPAGSLPQALREPGALKAAYRFFDHSDVTAQAILASHIDSTYARMQQHPRVLIVQDTTYFDFADHPHTTGMGPLQAQGGHGMLMHGVLAITPLRVPLGVLSARMWARPHDARPQRGHNGDRPIEDKESAKWLDGIAAAQTARGLCHDTDMVMVADREADIYEVYTRCADVGIGFVIRAFRKRRICDPVPMDLDARLHNASVLAQQSIAVPKRGKQAARMAQVQIKALEVELMPPAPRKAGTTLPNMALWAVEVIEPDPPPGVAALRWLLLTNVPVTDVASAQERVDWYRARWGIEVWHRILKSGCRVEARQLQNRQRLERMIALYAVIAWRVMYATLLTRTMPEVACTVLLEQTEWQALYCRIHATPVPCANAPPLREAVRWIAKLGGFIGRKSDGDPGAMTMWRGFQSLYAITDMYKIFNPDPSAKIVDDHRLGLVGND
jgi:Transposase DNA-binding/Transposase Tn5 dimerisation domain